MKNLRSVFLPLVLILAISVQAETITIFDSNATISAGDTYDTVVVKGDGTVVDMNGGSANTLIVMNSSTFNITGGIIGNIRSYNYCSLSLTSGNINTCNFFSNSNINLGGDTTISQITIEDYVSMTINDSANIGNLWCYWNPTINVLGGCLNSIRVDWGFDSTISISGGSINSIIFYLDLSPTSNVNIIGYGLESVPYGGDYGYGEVSGHWNDDSEFLISFESERTYPHIALYDGIIPERCFNKPESDLSGDCKVNFKDLSKMASEWLLDGTQQE